MRSGAGLTIVVAVLMLPVAGPAFAQAKGDYVLQCQREIRPKGYYTYDAGQRVPVVVPDQGGTQVEADALNACIRSKAYGKKTAATMMTPVPESSAGPVAGSAATARDKPRYTRKQRGAALLSGGSGYRGAYLEGGTGNGAIAVAPPETQKPKRLRRGLAPPPSGYPLLPGDEDLWYSLTPAQQERARQFLEDGSTIRSSLQAD
jgi:hypothetical protein